MDNIIGYINIYKKKIGFCLPVFDNNGVESILENGKLIAIHESLLEENVFYYKLSKKISFDINPDTDSLSLFVYCDGKKNILIDSNIRNFDLQIPSNLSVEERKILDDFYQTKKIIYNYRQFDRFISNDFGNKQKFVLDKNLPTYSIKNLDINAVEISKKNNSKLDLVFNDIKKHYDIAYSFLYFLKFKLLSKNEIRILTKKYFKKVFSSYLIYNDFEVKNLLIQIFFISLKNSNRELLDLLLDITFSKDDYKLINDVFISLESCTYKGNQSIKYTISFMKESLKYFVIFKKARNEDKKKNIEPSKNIAISINMIQSLIFNNNKFGILLSAYSKDKLFKIG